MDSTARLTHARSQLELLDKALTDARTAPAQRTAWSGFLRGEIVSQFLPGAGKSMSGILTLEEDAANLSADCGTYYMGCPNATQDPNKCPTVVQGSAESCCLCTGLGYPRCPDDPRPMPRDGGADSEYGDNSDSESDGGDSADSYAEDDGGESSDSADEYA